MRLGLTQDACSGKYDDGLVQFLIRNRLPATISAAKKSLDRNPYRVSVVKFNLGLFDAGNYGENLTPTVIGVGRNVYGIPKEQDIVPLLREATTGNRAVQAVTQVAPG